MGCTALTIGHSIDCRNSAGGVKAIYLAPFNTCPLVVANSVVTDMGTGSQDALLYKYEMKRGLGSITETIAGNTEAGTIFYTTTVNLKFHKLAATMQQEMKKVAAQRLIVFAELNQTAAVDGHNLIVCLGHHNGMELNSGTNASGAALGDMNGYDWTFEGMEPYPFSTVADYTTVPFDNTAFDVAVV